MSSAARRYAEALFSALGDADPKAVLRDLETFGAWLRAVPELQVVIENPGIPPGVKENLVKKLGAQAGFRDISSRFVLLVVTHRRIRQWADMVAAFRALYYEKTGITRARVLSAKSLGQIRKDEVTTRLAQILGRPVELEAAVSEELLGGLQVHIGSTVYDGSVAGALKSLRQALAKG